MRLMRLFDARRQPRLTPRLTALVLALAGAGFAAQAQSLQAVYEAARVYDATRNSADAASARAAR